MRVLREHGKRLGLPQRFTICDSADQLSAVKSAMRELRVHETTMHPSAVLARISLGKNRMETPEAFLAAVVAARRDRDHARLVREDQLRRRLTVRR